MSGPDRSRRAEVVTVGDEILAGATTDTNSGFIARTLFEIGVAVRRVTQVPDLGHDIQEAVQAALQRARFVVVTGGLGPTPDDHTKEDVAALFGDALELDEGVLESIRARFAARHLEMPAINVKQAMLPRGGRVIANPVGSAPGVHWQRGDGHVFLLPGVPSEMQAMLCEGVVPRIRDVLGDVAAVPLAVFRTTGRPESEIASRLLAIMEQHAQIDWAFYPSLRGVDVLLRGGAEAPQPAPEYTQEAPATARGDAPDGGAWSSALDAVRRELGDLVFTEEAGVPIEEIVGRLLRDRGATLAVAESCTGGLLGERITAVPGSSDYFTGGFLTYANATKRDWLDVPEALLDRHGAVSVEVALAMARGARARASSTYALAITGIAGPTGGTPEKPVGLVFVALAAADRAWTRRLQLGRRRDFNREMSAQAALDMLRRALLGLHVRDAV
jgi:nicotinamide-nucleotide amidase